jgi:hypothetical protein
MSQTIYFCGFSFNPETAEADCQEWLNGQPDIELEYLETQRASIQIMISQQPYLNDHQVHALTAVEKLLYSYIVNAGGVSSPVLRCSALGGDLVHINFDSTFTI